MAVSRNKNTSRPRRSNARDSRPGLTSASPRAGSPLRLFQLPLLLTVALFLVSLTPRVQGNAALMWSFWGACIALALFQAMLYFRFRADNAAAGHSREGSPSLEIALRPHHYMQALVQASVFAYWGYYWQPVYEFVPLLAGQILFAYVFDMLLSWSRRGSYVLGFGPFPIIFSINLFLWFRDEWFYMQFVMIAVGFLGKEFIRWYREGRSTHIFNPSAFTLGVFSLLLILTDTTSLTQGQNIASTLTLAPNIYTFLFLAGLVVMYLFSITLVAGMAALVLFALSSLYSASTGVPYFIDSDIPAAVFLGLHLLITDPATSPRTPTGKAIFGAAYGLGVFGLYSLLGNIGVPTFYDKLLCVPLLNLCVPMIDRLVQRIHASTPLNVANQRWVSSRTNLIHMAIWVAIFVGASTLGKTDGQHTGDRLPFWEQACADGRAGACSTLVQLKNTYCNDNSAWACNELGLHYLAGDHVPGDRDRAMTYFSRACELRFKPACANLLDPASAQSAPPREFDLRLLLREGGANLMDMPAADLYSRACEHGWQFACDRNPEQ